MADNAAMPGEPRRLRACLAVVLLTLGLFVALTTLGAASVRAEASAAEPAITEFTSSPNPSQFGKPVTFTVRVSNASSSDRHVTIQGEDIGNLPGCDLSNDGSCSVTFPLYRTDPIRAVYCTEIDARSVCARRGLTQTVTPLRITGSGTLPLGAESAQLSVDLTSMARGSQYPGYQVTGTCQLTGDRGTRVACTGITEASRNGETVILRGTGLYNDRQPISFTAFVTDGGTGGPDSFTFFGAGQRYGGNLTSGNIAVS